MTPVKHYNWEQGYPEADSGFNNVDETLPCRGKEKEAEDKEGSEHASGYRGITHQHQRPHERRQVPRGPPLLVMDAEKEEKKEGHGKGQKLRFDQKAAHLKEPGSQESARSNDEADRS